MPYLRNILLMYVFNKERKIYVCEFGTFDAFQQIQKIKAMRREHQRQRNKSDKYAESTLCDILSTEGRLRAIVNH